MQYSMQNNNSDIPIIKKEGLSGRSDLVSNNMFLKNSHKTKNFEDSSEERCSEGSSHQFFSRQKAPRRKNIKENIGKEKKKDAIREDVMKLFAMVIIQTEQFDFKYVYKRLKMCNIPLPRDTSHFCNLQLYFVKDLVRYLEYLIRKHSNFDVEDVGTVEMRLLVKPVLNSKVFFNKKSQTILKLIKYKYRIEEVDLDVSSLIALHKILVNMVNLRSQQLAIKRQEWQQGIKRIPQKKPTVSKHQSLVTIFPSQDGNQIKIRRKRPGAIEITAIWSIEHEKFLIKIYPNLLHHHQLGPKFMERFPEHVGVWNGRGLHKKWSTLACAALRGFEKRVLQARSMYPHLQSLDSKVCKYICRTVVNKDLQVRLVNIHYKKVDKEYIDATIKMVNQTKKTFENNYRNLSRNQKWEKAMQRRIQQNFLIDGQAIR